jgi:hypothetical protein
VRNLKRHPGSEVGALEVKIGLPPVGKPEKGGVWLDAKFDSTQFKKGTSIRVRMQKL